MSTTDRRPATPSDPLCSCGAAATVVFITERFGDVPWCGVSRLSPLRRRLAVWAVRVTRRWLH